MIQKFFPLDKNYLLEEAQLLLQDALLIELVEKVKQVYELKHNPLGLSDSFSVQIQNYKAGPVEPLFRFYQSLAAVYRFKCGDNQLEIIWDGRDHQEKYKSDWVHFFRESIYRFCSQELFIQAVLDLTVFKKTVAVGEGEEKNLLIAENRMTHFMLQEFGMRLLKNKGIVNLKVA